MNGELVEELYDFVPPPADAECLKVDVYSKLNTLF